MVGGSLQLLSPLSAMAVSRVLVGLLDPEEAREQWCRRGGRGRQRGRGFVAISFYYIWEGGALI